MAMWRRGVGLLCALVAAAPVAAQGAYYATGEDGASAEIHVYALDDGLQETLRSLIGKDVHLRGSLMGAHTQHHKAPIVMQVQEADAI
jgi:hypothetical protein